MKQIICLSFILILGDTVSARDIYVDASKGKDTYPGTLAQPMLTIQGAANAMVSGDACLIRAGVYRETVTPKTDGITFRNYEKEYVLITGLDEVKGWKIYRDNIWQADLKRPVTEPFRATEVFVDGQRMNWARYPNEDGDMLNQADMVGVTVDRIERDGQVLGTATIKGLPSGPPNVWAGAYFMGLHDKANWWTANKGRIIESDGEAMIVADLSLNWRNATSNKVTKVFLGEGLGYIIGSLQALDVAKEWHWQDGTLYLFPPTNTDMSKALLEARARTFGFDLTGRTGVTLQGLNFKAAALTLDAAVNCTVDRCTFRYAGSFTAYATNPWGDFKNGDGGLFVSGSNNTIKNCYIGRTWSHGVGLWGDHNVLENCLVEQCDWMGERMSAVWAPGDDNIIRHNTIRYTARDGIELGQSSFGINKYAKRALIQYNHVHHAGLLCPDSGLLYVNHQGGSKPVAQTEISYNLWHDDPGPHGGIYMDNMSSGYSIHHNVIWNVKYGVSMNHMSTDNNTHDVYVYHNTMINTEIAVRWNWGKSGSLNTHDIVVRNNHSNGGIFMGTQTDHNRYATLTEFVDAENGNYRLKADSPSLEMGMKLPGINDQAVGSPDLGAYEFGGPDWTAGASIEVPDFLDERRGAD